MTEKMALNRKLRFQNLQRRSLKHLAPRVGLLSANHLYPVRKSLKQLARLKIHPLIIELYYFLSQVFQ